jgi:hypothetical protein
MTGLIKGLMLRFLRGNWGKLLRMLLKAIAEGELGEVPSRVYWWAAGKKTLTGAVLLGAGAALETVCASFPDFAAWACPAARYVYYAGALLTTVGLVDGGTRAPWPTGTTIEPGDKRG